MANGIGFGAIVGLAEEVTYGTEVTPSTHWLPIFSHSLQESREIRRVPHLSVATGEAYHLPRKSVLLGVDVGGDIDTNFCYASKAHLLILKHALGAVGTTGAGPYVHTFTPDWDGVVGLSAHVRHLYGISDPAEDFLGLRVNQLELAIGAREWMTMRASCIGKTAGGMVALTGTPSYTDAEEVLAHHGSTLAWNSITLPMRRWRLMIDNNLTRRPVIGSLYTEAPSPGGMADITIEATVPWESHQVYTDFRDGDQGDAVFTFTGSGNNAMEITQHNVKWTEVGKPVDSAGERVFSLRGIIQAAPTTEYGLSIAVTNDNAAAV